MTDPGGGEAVRYTDLTVRTRNPEYLEATLQQLPMAGCVVIDGSWNGDTCVVRVSGNVGFIRYAITRQGYGEIVEAVEP